MHWIGMTHRVGQILCGPDWDLSQLGPDFLKEGLQFIQSASQKQKPFFLYYVPTANHFQRNQSGDYAVPKFLDGKPVKGTSRYTDGIKGTEREDMVIENDIAFGSLLKILEETDDPRNPGHKLIDNTLIIFTSDNGPNVGDNEGTNQESGGLKGKKAKIWEGGHRVPFILFRKQHFEGGTINRSLFSLIDLFATIAKIVDDALKPSEAQDSLDSLTYWQNPTMEDSRPRYFFCHLGPPYENDAIAIRQRSQKVIIKGGLARPWTERGSSGSSIASVVYDLKSDPFEKLNFSKTSNSTDSMINRLLRIHNQGYSRNLIHPKSKNLILDDGWHNLRNDITGLVGFQFKIKEDQKVTHLGMWDDHDRETPVRDARGIPAEQNSDQPSRSGKTPRSIKSEHEITLWEMTQNSTKEISSVQVSPGKQGSLDGEFRYFELETPIQLSNDFHYMLTMTTQAGDGDHFHDDVAFDGLSPLVNPLVTIVRSVMLKENNPNQIFSIPSFADLHPDYSLYRLPVGPTLRFQ
jgi:hypothetical protein